MTSEVYKMSVRGSKNKIIIYVVGACSIAFAILLYHNASQRLETMEISYERCHLNEESLSAQLQVNLEYKIRLEKSLQQEKSDHAQTKEELQKKLEDERQMRERENLEAINKFSTLKEHFNSIQHRYDIIQDKYEKLKQLQLSEVKDKRYLEDVVENLKKELNLVRENKEKDSDNWKVKLAAVESENSVLQDENRKLQEKVDAYEKIRTSPSDRKLQDNFPLGSSFRRGDRNDNQFRPPNLVKDGGSASSSMAKSSTTPNKIERELFPSANSILAKVSTPMINPEAVQIEEKIPIAPVPQPRQESSSMKDPNAYDVKENVAPKPEEIPKDGSNGVGPVQGVLGAPDIFNHFDHVPEIRNYKKQLKESEKNNHGGEVGDEDDGIAKNVAPNPIHSWHEGEFREQLLGRNPIGNEIPKNPGYQYLAEDEGRKEDEDDDDLDPIDYQHLNDKNNEVKENELKPVIQIPFGNKHESVMLQPK